MIWNIQFVSITMAVTNVNVTSVTKIRDSQTARSGTDRSELVRHFQIFVGPGPVRCMKIFKAF